MFCYLCQEEFVYFKTYCAICEKIKRIINVYSKNEVLEILEKVCLRKSEKLQNYKIKTIKKEIDKEIKPKEEDKKYNTEDNTYIDVNKNVLDELKKKLNLVN